MFVWNSDVKSDMSTARSARSESVLCLIARHPDGTAATEAQLELCAFQRTAVQDRSS